MIDALPAADLPVAAWEGCSATDLAHHWGLPAVHLFTRAGSTNDIARNYAQRSAVNGTMVIAEEQRAGRGRGARSWSSPPGLGLWCSFILRDLDPSTISMLPLRVALAVSRAMDPWTGGAIRVKWPNDLLLDGRKLGGILCEASWDGHRLDHVVVGVGLNLLQTPEDFPDPIREIATSLRAHAEQPVSRFEVAGDLVAGLRGVLFDRPAPEPEDVVAGFAERDALAGLKVDLLEVESGRVLLSGVANGIDRSGALLVEVAGKSTPVRSGTVRVRGD